ncbi:hypothetical protein BIY24_06670 [Halobacteriovorax marinus]|uniref:hypothetical protein n=1 Tax=Halobacteriovorax marinus TaxID=97084 RepID=UPI000BC2F65E|nr:hypothetical protein [Halobacteriovorax marinus]ATH07636.1 hypothetical protein BIY24_06670 [Halobacteriovorax marinus]
MYKLLKILILSSFLCHFAQAAVERIPLDSSRIPSNDLVHPELGVLDAEEAWQLQNDEINPLDLSKLDPQASAVWKNKEDLTLDTSSDYFPVTTNGLIYLGVIASQSGTLRFSVLDEVTGNVLTIVIDKNLHTFFLRRNLLRKLGYNIGPMKYEKKINVRFNSTEEKDHFLERVIPENTFGAPSRWLVGDSEFSIDLQDAMVMLPAYNEHYNVAFGVPPKSLKSRTLRSLIIPYALLNLDESVNVLSWKAARIEEESVELEHFTLADMNPTIDDAKWMLNKIKLMTRRDFEEIVYASHYPKEVAMLLVEKLISRRNSLMRVFAIDIDDITFNSKISSGEILKEGRLLQERFEGYGSRFAYGDPDSPFKEFKYSLLSKLQSDVLENLVGRANRELQVFDINDARLDYYKEEFQNGLDHFVETGEFLEQEVGAWVSPIVNGSLILSRDVVVGNHQGSDDLVQTADTFGYGVSLGANVGFEGLPVGYSALMKGEVNYVKTYTHLKPVQSLKASLKEPYKNMVVTLFKKDVLRELENLSNIENLSDEEIREEKTKAIIDDLSKKLGVGESLVISDRLTPSFMARGGYSWANTKISLTLSSKSVLVKRIHIYRSSADLIQVYIDKGELGELGFVLGLDNYIPITRIDFSRAKGKYKVELYNVNIDSDITTNPDLYKGASALHQLIQDGDKELLENYQSPYKLENNFRDTSTKYSFLNWRLKKLKKRGKIEITTPENYETQFYKYTHEKQVGANNWAFGRDIVNYYLNQITEFITLRNEPWKNPARTFTGVSSTQSFRFESRFQDQASGRNKYADSFLAMEVRKEGWKIKEKKLKKVIRELNEQFGADIFSDDDANDATTLKLYSIFVNLNIYEKGVWNLLNFDEDKIKEMARRYRRLNYDRRHCSATRLNGAPIAKKIKCGNFQVFIDKRDKCESKFNSNKDSAVSCLVDLAILYESYLEFKHFKEILGKDNIFIYGKITGFREESDILTKPIDGNSQGKITGKYWNGPVEEVRTKMKMQANEFNGSWLRESI